MALTAPYTSGTEMNDKETNGIDNGKISLTRELFGGEIYEYYPLGQYIVAAPGVCGGRPTFKYTRLEVSVILAFLAQGATIDAVIKDYWRSKITPEAVQEAIQLASQALVQSTQRWQLETA